jgi:phytoene dehydrogenase-like protein
MGDGPAGQSLDPLPAPIAHTSQMLGDDYLFWRISEGGTMAPFDSAMPAWESALTEEERWHAINYVRALGSGEVMPGRMMGGAMYDPEEEAAQRADMLANAVAAEVVSQEEADLFMDVHAAMDTLMTEGMPRAAGGMGAMQQALLNQLVNDGTITTDQATSFNDVHDRLLEAGLMQ